MAENVLEIENVSKLYRLGTVGTGTLSHDIRRWWHITRGKEDPYQKIGEENTRNSKGNSDYVWALKGINFEVKQSEVLGIIGKNGAGKSTLLKILSRITRPTTGKYKAKGRIASLLEVGTGFHPELSGRDNIFLNGAILGMTKSEIKSKFDDIVAFSGIERYIDTPVKRYSSGMYVRLAFAVAAHLEPEILIIDEVLAVGDAEFQKKCLGKMKDVASEGRTVLFVSHNMTAIKTLCPKSLFLANGEVKFMGDTLEAISKYFGGDAFKANQSKYFNETNFVNDHFSLSAIEIKSTNENPDIITMSDAFSFRIKLKKKILDFHLDINCQITNSEGEVLLLTSSGFSLNESQKNTGNSEMIYTCHFPSDFFNQGDFGANIFFVKNKKEVLERLNGVLSISILPANAKLGHWMGKTQGFFNLTSNSWELNYSD